MDIYEIIDNIAMLVTTKHISSTYLEEFCEKLANQFNIKDSSFIANCIINCNINSTDSKNSHISKRYEFTNNFI